MIQTIGGHFQITIILILLTGPLWGAQDVIIRGVHGLVLVTTLMLLSILILEST